MRIGFDAKRLFKNDTGLGNYSRTLVQNLHLYHPEHELVLYTPAFETNERNRAFAGEGYMQRLPGLLEKPGWRSFGMSKHFERDGIDVFHGLSHELPMGIKGSKTPAVVTMHDLLYRHFPEDFPAFDRFVYHQKFRFACAQAKHIIAISEATKNDIIANYDTRPEKITVLYQSISPAFFVAPTQDAIDKVRKEYRLPEAYILNVGSIVRRKNLEELLHAYALLPLADRVPLVIVGTGATYARKMVSLIERLDIGSSIIRIKHPTLEALNVLYREALCSVYPSLMEGFGLPVLESIAAGTPVITTNRSSLTEAGGYAATYIKGNDAAQLAETLRDMIAHNDRAKLHLNEQATAHLAQFDPEVLTQRLVGIYESLVG